MKDVIKNFNEYINEVAKVKDELEHSGRTFLQNLLTEFTDTHKINIVHESKRDKKGRGAPDFKFLFNDTEIGYLENKKIGEDLDEVLKSDQIRKYKTLTDNLILTDYIRWIWIYKDTIKEVRLCEKSELSNKTIKLNEQNCNDLKDLINDFLSQKPQEIVKARDLAEKLSKPTRTIKEEINDIVTDSESDKTSRIIGTYKVFKAEISENITPEDFADAFAQTLTYSLFLTKITLTSSEKLTLSNIANLTPKSFALIKDILAFINEIEDYPQLKPYIERIFHIINHTNAFEVVSDLQNNKDEFEDAYIHFYENFLTAYDKEKRKELGVWYTPKPVVRSIINNIHEILKEDFNLADGLADESVKVLDFACGTGTFLFEVYDKILSEISKTSLKRAGLIKNHILKNIFGFELLIPAYCVSHLKLSQHLKDEGYALEKDDRIRVYFTNTLENRHPDKQASLYENFFPAIAKEGKEAQEIKDDKSILVITGNPPYNAKSKNVLEGELLKFHEMYKCDDETNSKSIQDDYVKFIAFAHRKIKIAERGVFGLIVNNSFLSGLTHRKMRNELMKDFDKIYIINLHGGGEINGIKDENVFAIKQNVCIAIFVKNDKIKDKGVFQTDLIGKRLEKFKALAELKLPRPLGEDRGEGKIFTNTNFIEKSRSLRKTQTDCEKKFWNVVRNNQLGFKFRRQHSIDNKYIADFVCIEKQLIIELDGGQHCENKYDEKRDNYLIQSGFKLIRFWNNDIYENLEGCVEVVKNALTPTLSQSEREWQKLEIDEFNKAFKSTNWGKNRFADNLSFFYPMREAKAMLEYGKFVGLTDIFAEYGTGCEFRKDSLLVHFKENDVVNMVKDFNALKKDDLLSKYCTQETKDFKITELQPLFAKAKNYNQTVLYRPFDNRACFYTLDDIINKIIPRGSHAKNKMQNMLLLNNLGLIFQRQTDDSDWNSVSITNTIADKNSLGAQTYLAPLYLHKNDLEGERKEANFKPEFAKMVAEKFGSPSPEEVLAYIYAVLHSSNYRTKYLEFLKIDFPRIPFDCDKASFKRLAAIGQELIDAHLMRKIPKSKIGEPESDGIQNFVMEKVAYNAEKQRLYFNKTCYFADVSPEVWEFKIGGYQVLKQYLEGGKSTSRKGMDISSDLTTIQNIIKVLDFTIGKMGEIYDL